MTMARRTMRSQWRQGPPCAAGEFSCSGNRSIHPPAPKEFTERVVAPMPRSEEAARHRRRLGRLRLPIRIIRASDPLPIAIIAAPVIALIAAPLVASIIVTVARRQLILRVFDLASGIAAEMLDKAAAGDATAGSVIDRHVHEQFSRFRRWAGQQGGRRDVFGPDCLNDRLEE